MNFGNKVRKYLLLGLFCLTICFIAWTRNPSIISLETKIISKLINTKAGKLYEFTHTCKLPTWDPFDDSFNLYLRAAEDYYRKACDLNFKLYTSLKNGTLTVAKRDMECLARCVIPGEFYRKGRTFGPWLTSDSIFNCNTLQVHCLENKESTQDLSEEDSREKIIKKPDYRMIHAQVMKKKQPKVGTVKIDGKKYNILVLLADSISSQAADRYFPRSLRYLESHMKAVRFPYMNRVGKNTKPNGFSLFFGRPAEVIDRPPGFVDIEPNETIEQMCNRELDNETSIFDIFNENGYLTTYTDDYTVGLFNYPNCKGVRKYRMHHTFEEFYAFSSSKEWSSVFRKEACHFTHRTTFEINQQLFEEYKNQPQFAFNWINSIVHDYQHSSNIFDDDLIDFLYKMRNSLDETFVFFMADHGCRGMCGIYRLEQGQKEANNPVFVMTLPKSLRTPKNLQVVHENARKLQTIYDFRATLLDILKFQPSSTKLIDQTPLTLENELGSSLLRKQGNERTCFTLPIPFSYCICEYFWKKIDPSSTIAIQIGTSFIDFINNVLDKQNFTNICHSWEFGQVINISALISENLLRTYKVNVKAKVPNLDTKFVATIRYNEDKSLTVSSIDRADSYGDRGKCAPGNFEPFCNCISPKN